MISNKQYALLLSALLAPMVSVTGGTGQPSYWERFKGGFRRAAQTPTASWFASRQEMPVSPVKSLEVKQAEEEAFQAAGAVEAIDNRLIQAEKDLAQARANFDASKSGSRKHRKAAADVQRGQEQIESLGREAQQKFDTFVAARKKADTLRGDTSVTYGSFSFALARGTTQAEIAQLKREETAAIVKMVNAAADAANINTPEADRAADKAKQEYEKIKLAKLQKEEYLASMKAGEAKVELGRAHVEGKDTTQEEKAFEKAQGDYEKIKDLREAVGAQVKAHAAQQKPLSFSERFSRWQGKNEAEKTLRVYWLGYCRNHKRTPTSDGKKRCDVATVGKSANARI